MGGGGGPTDDESDLEQSPVLGRLSFEPVDEVIGGEPPHLRRRHAHGRQRRREMAGELDIIEANYRDVARNIESHCLAFDDHAKRSEEHTSELQSLMRISYAVFCLKKKNDYG